MKGYLVAGALLSLMILGSCSAPKKTTTTQGGKYSEDLSVWRPKATDVTKNNTPADSSAERKVTTYVEPKLAVNKQLDVVLDSIDRINLGQKYVSGYTIQVYSGKREEALNVKKQLTQYLPDHTADIQFTEPIFRVKVGKYYTLLEAQADYTEIKRHFQAAIIVPERISLN
jgi:hypothetical protein